MMIPNAPAFVRIPDNSALAGAGATYNRQGFPLNYIKIDVLQRLMAAKALAHIPDFYHIIPPPTSHISKASRKG